MLEPRDPAPFHAMWCETVAGRWCGGRERVVIQAVAVIPAAPVLIPELMGAAAPEVEPVREAARAALRTVATTLGEGPGRADDSRLMVVGAGRSGQDQPVRPHHLAGSIVDRTFGPALLLPPLPGAEQAGDDAPTGRVPTPLLVARRLLGDVAADATTSAPWAGTEWLTLRPDAVGVLADQLVADPAPVGLVLVADGAACHGPKAPRREDPRAQEYDDQVAKALTVADPVAFESLDVGLGRDLGAEGADLWRLLLHVAAADARDESAGWRAELTWRGAPYGVGWFVASGRR